MGGHHHLHLSLYLYLYLSLFFSIPLSAQVVIRDTIRISPLPEPVSNSLPASTIRLVFTHNGNVDVSGTAARVLILRNRFCGDNMAAQINGPVTEVFIPARGPAVDATSAFRVRQSLDFHRTYAFYLDDELVDSLHFVAQCPAACLFTGHVQTVPLYSSFTLGVDDPFHPFDLDHGETTQRFTLQYSATACGTTVWHPNCATMVRITEGAKLGTLVGPDGSDVGDDFVGRADEIRQLRFSASGVQPEEDVGEAVVEISSRGIMSVVRFEIRRTVPPIHHFSLLTDPDTVSHGSIADLFVTARDQSNNEIVIPPDTPLDLFVGAGSEQYGDLASTIHGTPSKGDQLAGVRYDQARVGGVIYIADGENPIGKSPPLVPIGVQLQAQPGVNGLGTVAVGCRIDPPRYAQGDARWGRLQYDSSYFRNSRGVLDTGRISGIGCALSSLAMALTAFGDTVTPGELNAWMTKRSSINGGFVGDAVNWLAPTMRNPGMIDLLRFEKKRLRKKRGDAPDSTQTTNVEMLTEYLLKCQLAIVQVFNTKTQNQHWVVVSGKEGNRFRILDPGGRNEKYLDDYGAVWSFAILSKRTS